MAQEAMRTSQVVKNLPASAGDMGSPGGVNGNLLQYSCLENSVDTGAWRATVMGSQRVGHH